MSKSNNNGSGCSGCFTLILCALLVWVTLKLWHLQGACISTFGKIPTGDSR